MEQETAWNDCKFQTLRLLMQEELLVSVDVGGTISRRGSFEEKDEGVKHWTCGVEVPVAHPGRKSQ